MKLLNEIKSIITLIAYCKDASVPPKACAQLIINNMGDTCIRETLGECLLSARDLRNGYNNDYGNYGDKVAKQVLNLI
jgi:hypothetical protein